MVNITGLKCLFIKGKFNLSLFGIGGSFENVPPVNDIEVALEKMLAQVHDIGKKVLVTIDEVTKNDTIRTFTSSFQLLIRQEYPIFLLMTGLYENIYELQNDDTLTFLYRSPRIDLAPLNKVSIKQRYQEIFQISSDKANELAEMTSGYSFAFQVLGYLCWKQPNYLMNQEQLLIAYDEYLQSYVYQKIWSELSEKDKIVMLAISRKRKIKNKELREELGFSSSLMSIYRDRLKRKGLIDTSEYGVLSIILPRLDHYILEYENFIE